MFVHNSVAQFDKNYSSMNGITQLTKVFQHCSKRIQTSYCNVGGGYCDRSTRNI